MKTKIQIKNYLGSILFEYEKENNTIKKTVEEAINTGATLSGANLSGANLSGATLYGATLSRANLSRANLSGATLYGATLYGATLSRATLSRATLSRANLSGATLYGATLSRANLSRANLSGANLSGATLSGANLSRADLSGANLSRADLNKIRHQFQIVPEESGFIAWKKGRNNHLIKLEIPKEAKRHNCLTSRKCRAEFVKVLDIRNSKGHKAKKCYGLYNSDFEYVVGGIVKADSYDPDPLTECSNGIHFFVTKQEAKDWN